MPHPLVKYLERRLDREAAVFEFGGGGSTLWLAARVGRVTTVEHDPKWFASIEQEVRLRGYTNCTLMLREPGAEPVATRGKGLDYSSAVWKGDFEEYARAIDDLPDQGLDLVLVDGRSRAACVVHALSKVRIGGMLVLDDSNRRRYRPAHDALAGWSRRDFYGLKPAWKYPSRATLWTRPIPRETAPDS